MGGIEDHNSAILVPSQRLALQETADKIKNGKISPLFKFLKIFPITHPGVTFR
jgi:hypothetical protein